MANRNHPRVVLYTRLSRESAASTSIAGQSDDLVSLAARNGWDVVATFTDNGKSGGKERANAQAAFDLWASGGADYLAVYAYDRWSRMGIKTLAALIEVVDARARTASPAVFIAVREGIESTQPDWQLRAAFAADMAKRERDLVSARQTAARDRMRRQGRNAGHGVPGFGYRTGPHPTLPVGRGLIVIPEERDIVREVADRIIADESLVSIARDLTERGTPTARSAYRLAQLAGKDPDGLPRGRWNAGGVARTWASDHLLGRLSHNRSPLYGAEGLPLTPFEPILSLDTVLSIRTRFDSRRSGAVSPKRRASALLSGLVFCGGCDRRAYPRRTASSPRRPRGYVNYACSATSTGHNCAAPASISGRRLEEAVISRWLGVMGRWPEHCIEESRGPSDTSAALADVEARIKDLAARMADADDEGEGAAIVEALAPLKVRRRHLRDTVPVMVAQLVPTGRTYGEAWEAASTEADRRSLLLMALDHVTVNRADAAERLVFHWRPGPDESPAYYKPSHA